ncbi:MAG TPA: TIGR03557 family F420-dependent LLM class oxidoreductase [Acidimicrobiales bacterium]|jgi:G6PDH family F420-dependent oxidoreductase|nr:TIGR03557 family F420-dependent LLM class oxidoreductase [Acidimicrobiales bacterium]
MTQFGYTLASEEHPPNDLVRHARRAEELGFDFLSISDHFHPWISEQGQSPFVWSTIGGVASVTERIELGVGVACPLIRIHPAIVAQAAATSAVMLEGRFFLGVGTGELLNEHVVGARWPAIEIRQEMLREAVDIIRRLCTGDDVDHHGRYYEVENARLFTHPEDVPPIIVSAFGPAAVEMAAEIGDGLWSTSPDPELLQQYGDAGGKGPRIGQVTLCWADNREDAIRTAHRVWPTSGIPGQLSQELPTPTTFEQAAQLVTPEAIAQKLPCGPGVEPVLEAIRAYEQAGFDRLHLHQIGPDQDGFFRFWEKELQPALADGS